MLIVNALIEKRLLESQHTHSVVMCARFVCLCLYICLKARGIVRKWFTTALTFSSKCYICSSHWQIYVFESVQVLSSSIREPIKPLTKIDCSSIPTKQSLYSKIT